ncbi:hypothetical protein D3C71_1904390 [compost metagenome]
MLTADGTLPSARAAAEKLPWSSTASKVWMASESKGAKVAGDSVMGKSMAARASAPDWGFMGSRLGGAICQIF